MSGRHENALLGKPPGGGVARIVFGRKRHNSHKSAAGIDQPLRHINARGQDVLARVRAHKAGQRADERALDVNAHHHIANQLVLGVECREPVDSRRHPVEPIGDDGGEHPAATVTSHRLAGMPHRVTAEVVGIEVEALEAVELKIEGMRHGRSSSCKAMHGAGVQAGAAAIR